MKTYEQQRVLPYVDVSHRLHRQVNKHLVYRTLDFFWLPWEGDDAHDAVIDHVEAALGRTLRRRTT